MLILTNLYQFMLTPLIDVIKTGIVEKKSCNNRYESLCTTLKMKRYDLLINDSISITIRLHRDKSSNEYYLRDRIDLKSLTLMATLHSALRYIESFFILSNHDIEQSWVTAKRVWTNERHWYRGGRENISPCSPQILNP